MFLFHFSEFLVDRAAERQLIHYLNDVDVFFFREEIELEHVLVERKDTREIIIIFIVVAE